MSIAGLIIVILIFVILFLSYPLACWVSGDNEVIDKCEELKKWAESELKERERQNRMICKNCIHHEICCNEGRDDEALTFCADFFDLVRCKDCVKSVCIPNHIGEDWYCDIKYNEWGEPWATTPGGFCIGGERKKQNEN